MSTQQKCGLIDPADGLSVQRQCQLLGLARSSYYYQPLGESAENLRLMDAIDRIFTAKPYYGRPRLTHALRAQGFGVNPKRVGRLMRVMGIRAIYPAPRTSVQIKAHPAYPYLLRNVRVTRSNQVWCSDITYLRVGMGFLYLVVIMDWYSRYVLSWRLSNAMDVSFCTEALEEALSYGQPEIFNTDKGGQYTSEVFTDLLRGAEIGISMTERGCWDNLMVERLWRKVKYEHFYLYSYTDGQAVHQGLGEYFHVYNHEDPHSSLNMSTPYARWK